MHRMVAAQRQARHNGFRRTSWHDSVRRHSILHDAVVDLDVQRAFVQPDTASALAATLFGLAETFADIGLAGSRFVLQNDNKSPFMRWLVAVIRPRPGIHINHSAWGDN